MPRGGNSNHRPRGDRVHLSTNKDFTVYDYANAPPVSKLTTRGERLKKGDKKVIGVEVKKLQSSNDVIELASYEKDVEDVDESSYYFDHAFDIENVPGDGKVNHLKASSGHKAAGCEVKVMTDAGRRYPVDLWFLISRYVEPESVGVFALICKDSLAVTHSAQFWQNMYRRYYTQSASLPLSLSLTCIDRQHGLKTRVVRALHYLYPPFITRSSAVRDVEPPQLAASATGGSRPASLVSLDALLGATCLQHWYEQVSGGWRYTWRFCRLGRTLRVQRDEDLLAEPDVLYNLDEGCVTLQVMCPSFVPVSPVAGLVLVRVETSAGCGVNSSGSTVRSYALGHRINLQFNSRYVKSRAGGGGAPRRGERSVDNILDPVKNIDVIHWWSKNFLTYDKQRCRE